MSVGVRLDLRQSQQLVMTPQLQQAIKLLQMNNLELADFVAQEIEKNPLLETRSNDAPDPREGTDRPDDAAPARERLDDQIREDRLGKAEETFDTGLENVYADQSRADAQNDSAAGAPGGDSWHSVGAGGSSKFESSDFSLEDTLTEEKTLREHLTEQLQIAAETPAQHLIGALLIDQLDGAGYLNIDVATIAEQLGATEAEIDDAIALLQGFDPAGIGARSLKECLALQLMDKGRYDPAIGALLDNLELLAKGEVSKLIKLCGVDAEDMQEMIAEIRRLDPKPGTRFTSEIAHTMIPDVYVRPNALGGWSVELNSETLPRVLVNEQYMTQISGDDTVKTYLSDCLQNANWLAKSLDQRARTILKVSTEIVRQQDGFFAFGVRELRPLNLKMIAEAIDMHESTVSRVTSNKYMATARGVFELKFFFTSAIAATDGGDAHSAEAIRHRIKELIDQEPPKKVLSDDKIVQILKDSGIDIARRTVAKYRESMHIPSSVQRRRMKAAHA